MTVAPKYPPIVSLEHGMVEHTADWLEHEECHEDIANNGVVVIVEPTS